MPRPQGQQAFVIRPKPRMELPKSPHGSWWITAQREGFTETARQLVTPPRTLVLESLVDKYGGV